MSKARGLPASAFEMINHGWELLRDDYNSSVSAADLLEQVLMHCDVLNEDAGVCCNCGYHCLEGWVACPMCATEDW